MTTVFDAAGEGSAKACWLLMRRAKRTGLSPQALPRNLRSFSQLPVTAPKNRTRIGPHHRRRKMNLFSLKTGYVRRSELTDLAGKRIDLMRALLPAGLRRLAIMFNASFPDAVAEADVVRTTAK